MIKFELPTLGKLEPYGEKGIHVLTVEVHELFNYLTNYYFRLVQWTIPEFF